MSKTLLMIHGVGCGGEVWDRMKRDFAMRHQSFFLTCAPARRRLRRSPT